MQQNSFVARFVSGIRDIGMAMSSVMPALRSAKGTYGTQRTESAELDAERRTRYPRD